MDGHYDSICNIYVDGMDIHGVHRHNVSVEWMDIKVPSVWCGYPWYIVMIKDIIICQCSMTFYNIYH